MLEPYQAAFTAPASPPPPPSRPLGPIINIHSTSDLTLDDERIGGSKDNPQPGCSTNYHYMEYNGGDWRDSGDNMLSRSPSMLSFKPLDPSRKVKSAVDLVSLVMREQMPSKSHFSATNV